MKRSNIFLACLLCTALAVIVSLGLTSGSYAASVSRSEKAQLLSAGLYPKSNGSAQDVPSLIDEEDNLKNAEKAIFDALFQCEGSFKLSDYKLSEADFVMLYERVVNNNPCLFHVSPSYRYSTDGKKVTKVLPEYTMSDDQYNEAYKVYRRELDKIVGIVGGLDNNISVIIAVNDFITSTYSYDTTGKNSDVYSLIVSKKGTCHAYTMMFTAAMQELGIPVTTAVSDEMDHIWNIVYTDGEWYHVDTTWNDPVNGILYYSRHDYLLLSDMKMVETGHYLWDAEVICTSTAYDSAFWQNVTSPFVSVDNTLYYISSAGKSICSYNPQTRTIKTLCQFDYIWYKSGSNAYYSGMFSGLSAKNEMLFFNSPTALMMYEPKTNKLFTLCKPELYGNYIYSSCITDGYFYFTLNTSPEHTEVAMSISLDELLPKVSVSWNVEGVEYRESVMYGTRPVYMGEELVKNYDKKYHYEFAGWFPEEGFVYCDTEYVASFMSEAHDIIDGRCACGYIEYGFVDGGKKYLLPEGGYAKGWLTVNGKTYRFDPVSGLLYEKPVLHATLDYYFAEDHSTVEGLVAEDGGERYYIKGVRQIGWVDTDGNGEADSYFYSTTALRCREDRYLFDGIATRRFYRYDDETGHMKVVDGFYTDKNGTRFFKNGLGVYGWVTAEGEHVTDKPGITLSGVYYFAYGNGVDFYRVDESERMIGGVLREFDENHLVKSYTGWNHNKNTGIAKYYIDGVMQEGWCLTPDGWVYLSRSDKPSENRTYGDALTGWWVIGGKMYYLRSDTSTPSFVVISDAQRELTYNGERSTYYINQTPLDPENPSGADYYITNPPM